MECVVGCGIEFAECMKIEKRDFYGWENTVLLSNGQAEVLVTTDVGPRVISYEVGGRGNIFKVIEAEAGGRGEAEFQLRGGHRLWLAPESEVLSYHADNGPVEWRHDKERGEVVFESLQSHPVPIRKVLGVSLAEGSSRVTIRHCAINEGQEAVELATWGLTAMRSGGIELIPQPVLGEHPRDLLPNRRFVFWPYTDLADSRIHFGTSFLLLRQEAEMPPLKFGLDHREGWVAYLSGDLLFLKAIESVPGAIYPDMGCNFETFTNGDFLEIESLGVLRRLEPGESVTHHESWYLFPVEEEVTLESEEALIDWISPYIGMMR